MNNNIAPATEKRARRMFEDSRRGAQLFTNWNSITEGQRQEWRGKAEAIEMVICAKLAEGEGAA